MPNSSEAGQEPCPCDNLKYGPPDANGRRSIFIPETAWADEPPIPPMPRNYGLEPARAEGGIVSSVQGVTVRPYRPQQDMQDSGPMRAAYPNHSTFIEPPRSTNPNVCYLPVPQPEQRSTFLGDSTVAGPGTPTLADLGILVGQVATEPAEEPKGAPFSARLPNLTVGFGSIPGFPDKYRPVIPPEVQDYLNALEQVARILRGEHVSPMLGGTKAGLIQGWTYVVDDKNRIWLKPWRKGIPPVPLPEQPENPNHCRIVPWEAGMTIASNDGELPLVFGLRIYEQIAAEQDQLKNSSEWVVVAHIDGAHALILRGECSGLCRDPREACRPRYLKTSWDDELRKDLETEESLEAPPSLAEETPPGTLEFATNVTCECQSKEQ